MLERLLRSLLQELLPALFDHLIEQVVLLLDLHLKEVFLARHINRVRLYLFHPLVELPSAMERRRWLLVRRFACVDRLLVWLDVAVRERTLVDLNEDFVSIDGNLPRRRPK